MFYALAGEVEKTRAAIDAVVAEFRSRGVRLLSEVHETMHGCYCGCAVLHFDNGELVAAEMLLDEAENQEKTT